MIRRGFAAGGQTKLKLQFLRRRHLRSAVAGRWRQLLQVGFRESCRFGTGRKDQKRGAEYLCGSSSGTQSGGKLHALRRARQAGPAPWVIQAAFDRGVVQVRTEEPGRKGRPRERLSGRTIESGAVFSCRSDAPAFPLSPVLPFNLISCYASFACLASRLQPMHCRSQIC